MTAITLLAACGGPTFSGPSIASTSGAGIAAAPESAKLSAQTSKRRGFLGAFFRPEGSPPYGVFMPQSPGTAPQPYPSPGTTLTGAGGYCNGVAANGASIAGSWAVDPKKLADIVNLGVGWTRMSVSPFFDDLSHLFGAGQYAFGSLDSAQCSTLVASGIAPVIGLEAGPVMYNAVPGTFSPQSYDQYQTASDFAQWCGVVAAHEKTVFGVKRFSIPGNEVNSNTQLFPGGAAQVASYSQACYSAIKAAVPDAFVYGLELNMDGNVNAPGFVGQLYAMGCKIGTCYDGIAMHLTLRYPIPSSSTPCYPNPGGDYSLQCVTDIQKAAQSSTMHVLISESAYPVPAAVPDEQTKAQAVLAAFTAYAGIQTIDGVSYANVDECALYPTGYFSGACLVDTAGNLLPAYSALKQLATSRF